MRSKATLDFFWGMLGLFIVFFGYVFVRSQIYEYYSDSSEVDWINRDMVMNIPRVICALLLLFFLRKFRPNRPRQSVSKIKIDVVVVCFGMLILAPLRQLFFDVSPYSEQFFVAISFGSLLVGVFEEALFRVGFFDILTEKFGLLSGLVVSSILFSLFHIQAQPSSQLLPIFMYGIFFGLLRWRGMQFALLASLHATYDILVFFWVPVVDFTIAWRTFEILILAAFSLVLYRCREKHFGV